MPVSGKQSVFIAQTPLEALNQLDEIITHSNIGSTLI